VRKERRVAGRRVSGQRSVFAQERDVASVVDRQDRFQTCILRLMHLRAQGAPDGLEDPRHALRHLVEPEGVALDRQPVGVM
jgi:hypothetical protein